MTFEVMYAIICSIKYIYMIDAIYWSISWIFCNFVFFVALQIINVHDIFRQDKLGDSV